MKLDSLYHTVKGITAVGFTGIGMFCLSNIQGITGVVFGFFFLYLAFFTSVAFHHYDG